MVFFGEYLVTLTEGGRVVIPKKVRENLSGDTFVLTKGFNECLAGYGSDDWTTRSKDLLNVSLLETENIDKRRYIFSGAHYVTVDDQGRFVIPKSLMTLLGEKLEHIMIVGVGDHFEVWNETRWREYIETAKI